MMDDGINAFSAANIDGDTGSPWAILNEEIRHVRQRPTSAGDRFNLLLPLCSDLTCWDVLLVRTSSHHFSSDRAWNPNGRYAIC